jgi:hypothetical protein
MPPNLLADVDAKTAVVMVMVVVVVVMIVRPWQNAVIPPMMMVVMMVMVILRDLFTALRPCCGDAGVIRLQGIHCI